jgi:uncharacterized Zn finger protein
MKCDECGGDLRSTPRHVRVGNVVVTVYRCADCGKEAPDPELMKHLQGAQQRQTWKRGGW